MEVDKDKYRVYDWKNFMVLHWLINPGLAINELLLGQRVAKIMLEDKTSDKPRYERGIIPCPHCNTFHDGRIWSIQNGTAFKNWFGLYCPSCGDIIPCLTNFTSLIILAVTSPLWIWFKKPLKKRWLDNQPQRYKNIDINRVHPFNKKSWVKEGLGWGIIMYFLMVIVLPFFSNEEITWAKVLIGLPVWLLAGLVWGYSMNKFFASKNKNNSITEAR